MIEISKLTDKDIGRWVEYRRNYPERVHIETGKIKSWNDTYIFVVYKCNGEWHRFKDFTGVSTNPEDLFFTEKEGNNL